MFSIDEKSHKFVSTLHTNRGPFFFIREIVQRDLDTL